MIGLITRCIDLFYPLFKGWMPLKTYRYAACGGGNMALDLVLYFICHNFVVAKQNVDLGFVVLSPHIASLFFVYPITFLTGFWLSKYVTFTESNIQTWTQFLRYFMVSLGAIVIGYLLMKLFVDVMGIYPTPSKLLTIVIAVCYSYLLQNYYTFKVEGK